MNLVLRFWDWLTANSTGSPKKGHPDLYPLDVAKLTKDLNLAEEAKRLGLAGLPSPEAKVPAGPEAAVIQRVEKARQDYADWAVLRLNVLDKDLGKRSVTTAINRARQADKEFERKAGKLMTEQDSLLRRLGDTARKRRAELANFQAQHRLNREAHIPGKTRSFLLMTILVLMVLVEGVLNAWFFAQGLDSGWLGGFFTAGVFAAFNVLIAYFLGRLGVRYVVHVHPALKTVGVATVLAAFCLMVTIGLGIAHYRDALTHGAEDAANAALGAFVSHPFQLRDIFSWPLFGISIGFAVAALLDGIFADERYPGYGNVTRRTLDAVSEYDDELEDLRMELEALKDDELTILDQTAQDSQAHLAVIESLIAAKKAAGLRLSTAFDNADNSMLALLSKFRTDNEVHRNGLPRPEYFDRMPELRPVKTPDFDTSANEFDLAKQRGLVQELLAEVQEIRGRIQQAFNHQFDRHKPLDFHFPAKEAA
jgi:hypothetical protein